MNVIIANQQKEALAALDIDVIKSISGEFDAEEIVEMFKNFFFGRMIIDLTAIKNYTDVSNIQKISIGLDVEKLIFLLPNNEVTSSSSFLTKIISMGIYNFTTNVDGVKYLLDNPNSYKDVAHIQQLNELSGGSASEQVLAGNRVIGFKNITDHAGATTLLFMLKKELEMTHGVGNVYLIEVNRHDLSYFNVKNVISTTTVNLLAELAKIKDAAVVLIDLNDCEDESACGDVLYLVEPSTIKLNKLMRQNRNIFQQLKGKKIVLNKSLLSNKDIADFEYEAKTKVFYNIPPLDERKNNNEVLTDFLTRIGLIRPKEPKEENRILGLFRL